jgi:putative tricarboxylic transport membrane protein
MTACCGHFWNFNSVEAERLKFREEFCQIFRTLASGFCCLPDLIENTARFLSRAHGGHIVKHIFLTSIFAAAIALPAFAADYTIMAPAAPGGGWDQTARSLQTVMQKEGISSNVQVMNVPGAGGTIGLAQFTGQNSGNPKR